MCYVMNDMRMNLMEHQAVKMDDMECLNLGRMFALFSNGEARIGAPYTGIYYDDTRYISRYVLRYDNTIIRPSKVSKEKFAVRYFYECPKGNVVRTAEPVYGGFVETIDQPAPEASSLEMGVEFADIFDVRADMVRDALSVSAKCDENDVVMTHGSLRLARTGTDGKERVLLVEGDNIAYRDHTVIVRPRKKKFKVGVRFYEIDVCEPCQGKPQHFLGWFPKFRCDDVRLNSLYRDSVSNMVSLFDCPPGKSFFPLAGIPLFDAVFGRDALIASLQLMHFFPPAARSTILRLGKLIGKKSDKFTEEEPGKIIHEKRCGEKSGAVLPFRGYYGSIDSTPLYVLAFMEYIKSHGMDSRVRIMRKDAIAALEWIKSKVKAHGLLGYVGGALSNQGWKDSPDSVFCSDGSLSVHPVFLVEVQAYAGRALELGSQLVEDDEERKEMMLLARGLREAVVGRYWSSRLDYPGEAIDGKRRLADIVTSNPGHLLWMNFVDNRRAKRIADVMVDRNLLNSGYGVKTLAYGQPRHDPTSYHDGSVWPHENSLILKGLSDYSLHEEFTLLLSELLDAYKSLNTSGFPELYSGGRREEMNRLGPMGCLPTAWGSGAVFAIIQAIIGLKMEENTAGECVVRFDPILPDSMDNMKINGLRVMGGVMQVSLRRNRRDVAVECFFTRKPKSRVKIQT